MARFGRGWRAACLVFGVGGLAFALLATPPRPGVSSPRAPAPPDDGETVVVPAGAFVVGGDPLDGEGTARRVFVAAFRIDRTEVTNAAFAAFVARTGYRTVAELLDDARTWRIGDRPERAVYPVVFVAWDDAVAYCAHVDKRLPTEEEWEKAARGDDGRWWPWGDEWDETRLNALESGLGDLAPVGTFAAGASPYGLIDMAGNVWEWTSSVYTTDEDAEVFRGSRVLRGGSWRTAAAGTRTTYRKPAAPDYRRDATGFRCAADVS